MLDIIILIFLARSIGRLAVQKGVNPGSWKLYIIIGWIAAEFAGILLAVVIFPDDPFVPALLLGLGCAYTSYLVLRSVLSKKPDHFDEDINSIGVNDLRP
jgi:hypothetical protein